ncbi:MAG: copper transporter [Nocardioidaceae bacterium]
MIDFRYHVISIVAIFLALATGIALGAGPLGNKLQQGLLNSAAQDRQDKIDLRTNLDSSNQMVSYNDDFVSAVAGQLLGQRLSGRTVAVFSLPGADPNTVAAIRDDIAKAGGTVVADVTVSGALLDPANRQTAENLAGQVLDGVPGLPNTAGASSYQLVGYSVARGFLATPATGAMVDPTAQEIQAAFDGAHYLSYGGDINKRGNLAVLVAGPPAANVQSGQGELLATVAKAMDALSGGVVVSGPLTSAGDGGYIQAVRASDAAASVSTVDVADVPAGQVATALALEQQADGAAGQYGIGDGADSRLPVVSTGQ